MYELYVIPGSHACRSAIMMLERKRVPFEVHELTTLLHPVLARMHGFDAGGQRRVAGSSRTPALRLGDALATVPGLADGDTRVSTNYRIARYLDARHPDVPLVPRERRAEVEAIEAWANHLLQMEARRVLTGAAITDAATFSMAAANGRMGPLLYRHPTARRAVMPLLRWFFAAETSEDQARIARLPELLDKIDAWIADGVIGTAEPNVADFMIAPSLALMLYRQDIRPLFRGRACLAMVDRLLPEPSTQ